MIAQSPGLAKFFDNYRQQVSQELQSDAEKLAVRAERKRVETEQQKLVKALHYSTQSLVLALNVAKMGLWDWNLLTQEIVWTPYHETILEYEPGKPNRTYKAFIASLSLIPVHTHTHSGGRFIISNIQSLIPSLSHTSQNKINCCLSMLLNHFWTQ
ncbi:hypothetical protein [Nostoc sp.]|uniref:hypothetical protein n=1 Tax=Nostoc sp. TaxID=1180 RepID=UPI002FF7B655